MSFIKTSIKLLIVPSKVTATPPIGPILSQNGINAIDFCKLLNEHTTMYNDTLVLPVLIFLYSDYSYTFFLKMPSFFFLIKKILKLNTSKKSFFFRKKKKNTSLIVLFKVKNIDYYLTYVNKYHLQEFCYLLLKPVVLKISLVATLRMYIGTLHSSGIYVSQY